MNCAIRNCVCATLAIFLCLQGFGALGKDNVTSVASGLKEKFQWNEHARLTWDDFKGEVNATHDESAAATYCSIGFKTVTSAADGKQEIVVYNTFYTNKSWVRADARIQSILDHEQGHFDLCELYTRKLKERMNNVDAAAPNVKQELMRIYAEVSKDYEARQQAYEEETSHGTNLDGQKKWQEAIAIELESNSNSI